MAFDLFVQRFHHGRATAATNGALWEVLRAAWDAPPDEHGHVRLVRGNGEAGLYGVREDEPIDSLTFSRPAGGADICDLIVEVARAGDMVIYGPGMPACLMAEEQRAHLPRELAEAVDEPVVVTSGSDLLEVIASE